MEAMLLDKEVERGNALLLVRFAQDERLPPTLTITSEDKPVLVRDDGSEGDEKAGDGVFSTVFRLDLDALAARRAELARPGVRERMRVPEFEGRALERQLPLPDFDLGRIKPGVRFPFPLPFPPVLPGDVSTAQSLVITDVGVVEDPARTFNACSSTGAAMGKWTFGYLMTQMANSAVTGLDPSVFTLRLLEKWNADQTVNTFNVPKRVSIKTKVIDPWKAASGGGALDLAKAPFRLLAIVNRVDLADNLVYGQGSAGEARFVFGLIGPGCNMERFTVIFEYGVEAKGCSGLKSWTKQWFDLKNHPIGSAAYNAALEAITEQFVKSNAAPAKPNGSALNQLRTNEIALAILWELREFRLDPLEGGHFREVTVKQNPHNSFHQSGADVDTMSAFVNANEAAVVTDSHVVPLDVSSGSGLVPFLGGAAPTPGGTFWNNGPGLAISNREARHHFSLNTCNGCHAGETATGFLHIGPAPFGTPAPVSGFMSGIDVSDPADGSNVACTTGCASSCTTCPPTAAAGPCLCRHFDDQLRRQARTAEILSRSCLGLIGLPKLKMVH